MGKETRFIRAAACEQRMAYSVRVEACPDPHGCRVALPDRLVVQLRVEIVADPLFKALAVHINHKCITIGVDAGEIDRKQIGQRRPVKPVCADRRSQEGKTERQRRIDAVVKHLGSRLRRLQQLRALGPPPEVPEGDLVGRRVVRLAHQGRDGGADLDADRIALRREDARVRRAVRRDLAGLVLVAIQTVDADSIERLKIPLPHPGKRPTIEPRVVGYEADYSAARLLGDSALRHAEESDVKVMERPAIRHVHPLRRPVGFQEFQFFIHRDTREAVVGRIAEDHEDRGFLLHPLRPVALLLQLREGERLGRSRLPAGERVGEEDAGAFAPVVGEWRVEIAHRQPDLQMGNDEGGGHDLEAEHPFGRRLPDPRAGERAETLTLEIGGDAAQHFRQVGPGAATRIEHVDVLGGETLRDVEIVLERLVHPCHHVADHLRRCVPDAELLAERGVEGFEETARRSRAPPRLR